MSDLYKKIIKSIDPDITLKQDEKVDFISTGVFTLNLLFGGSIRNGIPVGKVSMMAAPPQLGKSLIGLILAKNAQKKGLFVVPIITEKSFNFDVAKSIGLDISEKKMSPPIVSNSIEEITHTIVKMTDGLTKAERRELFFLFDSWGTLVDSKTMGDALEGKDVANMAESKKFNKLAKIILNTDSTFFIINHVYANIGGYGDPYAIPGGTKVIFACDCVVMGSSKAKSVDEDDELNGAIVSCKTVKSRFSRERSALKFKIKWDSGPSKFFGLLDQALEGKYIIKPKNGCYSRPCVENDKEWKEHEMVTADFWFPVFKNTDFEQYLENKFSFKNTKFELSTEEELEVKTPVK